jgi:glycosyltransferase involved in cell wall biosynthesis
MKLLHILPGFHPQMGGTRAFVKAWAKASDDFGVFSEIIALQPEGKEWESEDISVVGIPSKPGTFRYSSALVPWLERHLSNFDAVVIHGIWQYHSVGAWRVLRRHAIPYYVFPHGMLDDWFRRTYPLKHLKKCLYWWVAESKVLRDARGVIFTSEDERISSRNAFFPYRVREVVASLGISEPPSHVEREKSAFLQKYPEIERKRVLLFLGRLHCKKGCDLLIKSFLRIAEIDSNVVLVMAGPEGEEGYLQTLQSMIDEKLIRRIIWTGLLEGDLKWGAIRSAELFVLPSHQENFGMAVAEALACGIPVFVSNRVNIWREIEEGNAGIIEDDTEEGVFRGLSQWMGLNPEAVVECRKNARALFEKKFGIHGSIQNLTSIIFGS